MNSRRVVRELPRQRDGGGRRERVVGRDGGGRGPGAVAAAAGGLAGHGGGAGEPGPVPEHHQHAPAGRRGEAAARHLRDLQPGTQHTQSWTRGHRGPELAQVWCVGSKVKVKVRGSNWGHCDLGLEGVHLYLAPVLRKRMRCSQVWFNECCDYQVEVC